MRKPHRLGLLLLLLLLLLGLSSLKVRLDNVGMAITWHP